MRFPPFTLIGSACLALLMYAAAAGAQVDLSGNWAAADSPDRLVNPIGPLPVDYVGIPLNAEGRAMGATADPSDEQQELNRQCQVWLVNYFVEGPFPIAIRPITDPITGGVIAWHMSGTPDRLPETIWVNGHPPPPLMARHTWTGFASGHWEGDTLAVSIIDLKDGWMTRGDAPESNQETVSMFLNREDDLLTMNFIIHDPVYLGAPYARGRTFRIMDGDPNFNIAPRNDCAPAEIVSGLSDGYHAARFLPGKNPDLNYMMTRYHIPLQVAVGGPEEIYPEFRDVLRKEYTVPPGYCQVDCCSAQAIRGTNCPAPPKAAAPGGPATGERGAPGRRAARSRGTAPE